MFGLATQKQINELNNEIKRLKGDVFQLQSMKSDLQKALARLENMKEENKKLQTSFFVVQEMLRNLTSLVEDESSSKKNNS